MRFDRTLYVDGLPTSICVSVADHPWARMRGLLGQQTLALRQALLLRPCWNVHTVGMRFHLDLFFVRRDGMILRCDRDVGPRQFRACWGAAAVLESAPGALSVEPGQRLSLE